MNGRTNANSNLSLNMDGTINEMSSTNLGTYIIPKHSVVAFFEICSVKNTITATISNTNLESYGIEWSSSEYAHFKVYNNNTDNDVTLKLTSSASNYHSVRQVTIAI